jgi:uncharacterized protein YjbI with pentapeptide repeats
MKGIVTRWSYGKGVFVTAVLASLILLCLIGPRSEAAADSSNCNPSTIAEQKLCQEIRQLEIANRRQGSRWQRLLDFAPFITALAAAGGFLLAWRKQVTDLSNQRTADRSQRESDSRRRFDDTFAQITTNLASESTPQQASAAATALALLRPENAAFEPAILELLSANVKLQHDPVVTQILVRALARVIRLQAVAQKAPGAEPLDLSLAGANLARIKLAGVDLKGGSVDVAFSNLEGADLTDANLWRIRGFGVHLVGARLSRAKLGEARFNRAVCADALFHDSVLVAATLKGADLEGAQFHRARLQSAHLEGANLTGAIFIQANLKDAYLYGVTLDETARTTLVRAEHWREAHLDGPVREDLKARSAAALSGGRTDVTPAAQRGNDGHQTQRSPPM